MDSRIANKDKTILSLQLEDLEPVFMGEEQQTLPSTVTAPPGIFTVEMCAKIAAMGFLLHENSYLRSDIYSEKVTNKKKLALSSRDNKSSYSFYSVPPLLLRNAWNIMDFIVVTSG
jgi:hypothetical protein